jgi:hypothetical protein
VVLTLGAREPRVDVELLVLGGDHGGDVGVGGGGRGAVQVAGREREHLRPEDADERVDVDLDVAHPVHRVAEHAHAQGAPARHRGCRPRPAPDRVAERVGAPVVGDHVERAAGPDHRVGRVLRAVDALVVRQVRHVPVGRHGRDRLHVREADRELGRRQQPRHPHRRPVGEHHDEQAVEVG